MLLVVKNELWNRDQKRRKEWNKDEWEWLDLVLDSLVHYCISPNFSSILPFSCCKVHSLSLISARTYDINLSVQ